WEAWTRPELLKRWWAPRSLGVILFECDVDVRVGGSYRYAFGRDPAQPMVFSGTYREVVHPSRLVFTQLFEQMRFAGEAIITATLEEQGDKTRLVMHALYPSKEALDGAVASGMERGMRETYEQLEQLVATMV
ncbi:MAG TPA: SRPBCC family protein, partial [Polyangiaceae bacterium]